MVLSALMMTSCLSFVAGAQVPESAVEMEVESVAEEAKAEAILTEGALEETDVEIELESCILWRKKKIILEVSQYGKHNYQYK